MKKKIFILLISILLLYLYFLVIKSVVLEENPFQKNVNLISENPVKNNPEEEKVLPVINNEEKITEEQPVIEEEQPTNIDNNTETENPEDVSPKGITLMSVPFTSQAPFGGWSDLRQEDGCEEASSLMAMLWVKGKKEISKEEALKEILAISDFELEEYGSYMDTSASDTIKRILVAYFDYDEAELQYDIEAEDIIAELEKGNIVMAPFNGRKLGNPNFVAPGPERHMLLIIGYDYDKKEFITNDPGTRNGKGYRYDREVLETAIRDYVTGENLPIVSNRKAMIVIGGN
ncbi:MAG: C39 family peptidase [Candidatus Magasanikbacteria bacterium]|nr:C39 family peptidase [Candidatus Magasanikbacteria bacterium]